MIATAVVLARLGLVILREWKYRTANETTKTELTEAIEETKKEIRYAQYGSNYTRIIGELTCTARRLCHLARKLQTDSTINPRLAKSLSDTLDDIALKIRRELDA